MIAAAVIATALLTPAPVVCVPDPVRVVICTVTPGWMPDNQPTVESVPPVVVSEDTTASERPTVPLSEPEQPPQVHRPVPTISEPAERPTVSQPAAPVAPSPKATPKAAPNVAPEPQKRTAERGPETSKPEPAIAPARTVTIPPRTVTTPEASAHQAAHATTAGTRTNPAPWGAVLGGVALIGAGLYATHLLRPHGRHRAMGDN